MQWLKKASTPGIKRTELETGKENTMGRIYIIQFGRINMSWCAMFSDIDIVFKLFFKHLL